MPLHHTTLSFIFFLTYNSMASVLNPCIIPNFWRSNSDMCLLLITHPKRVKVTETAESILSLSCPLKLSRFSLRFFFLNPGSVLFLGTGWVCDCMSSSLFRDLYSNMSKQWVTSLGYKIRIWPKSNIGWTLCNSTWKCWGWSILRCCQDTLKQKKNSYGKPLMLEWFAPEIRARFLVIFE